MSGVGAERTMPALERVLLDRRAATRLVGVEVKEWRSRLRIATFGGDGPAIVSALRDQLPLECLQAAGTALLVALARGAPRGIRDRQRCCAALRDRGATGDDELAIELEVAMGRAPEHRLTPVPVDLEELALVLVSPWALTRACSISRRAKRGAPR
jgi:hypothetical protein